MSDTFDKSATSVLDERVEAKSGNRRPPASAGFGAAMRGAVALFLARPLTWLLVLVWLLQIVVFAYTINASVYSQDPSSGTNVLIGSNLHVEAAHVWPLASMPTYGSFVFVLLGAFAGGSDYRYGTFRLILPRYSSRAGLLGARVVVLAVLAVIISALTVAVSFAASFVVSSFLDFEVKFPAATDLALSIGLGSLVVITLMAAGFAASLILRSLLGGFLTAFLWVVGVEVLLLSMLAPLADWLRGVRGSLPVGASSSLVAVLGERVGIDTSSTAGMSELVSPWVATAALCGWTFLLFAGAISVFQYRDT